MSGTAPSTGTRTALGVLGRFYHGLSADEISVTGVPCALSDIGSCSSAGYWKWAIFHHVGPDIAGDRAWIEIMEVESGELLR